MAKFMTLKEAIEQLDLAAVWDMAPNQNGTACPSVGGVIKSPFRVDQKGASFSITRDLKLFKDHAEPEHKGGVWKFVELARPEWTKREIVREIISRAGGDPDEKDPNWKPESVAARELKKRQSAELAHRRHISEQRTIKPVAEDKVQLAGPKLASAYRAANAKASEDGEWQYELAAERGWPVSWVRGLLDMGKLAMSSKRQPAFAVEYFEKPGAERFLGVHSRWIRDDGGKAWAYRPCLKFDKQEVAAAPFVLGSLNAPIWILCEGQWDAATVYGLLDAFGEYPLMHACVFGIRGVSGVDVFMALYGAQLRRVRPSMLLVPDCDKAGAAWTQNTEKKWSFMRKLKANFPCLEGRLAALKIKPVPGCKDVNDFYKDRGLTGEQFAAMVHTLIIK